MTNAIQKDELEVEIRTLKTKKAPGPDGVTNDMILHLGPSAKKAILALFNKSWKSGTSSSVEKGHNNPYVQERKRQETSQQLQTNQPFKLPMKSTGMYTRLMANLKANNILSPTQSGYRKHRSTEDQLALLAQEIENAFQEKK